MSRRSEGGSLLSQLSARLRQTGESLPVIDAIRAGDRLDEAIVALTRTLESSSHEGILPALVQAQTHLDRAIAAMNTALESLDTYLIAIGADGVNAASPPPRRRFATLRASAEAARERPSGLVRWWVDRVCEITEAEPPATPPNRRTGRTPQQLLRELTYQSRAAERDGYREVLLRTDPAEGLRLPALAQPALRHFATELFGRPPVASDLDRLIGITDSRVRSLLPRLPDTVVRTLCGRACHAPGTARQEHPVDTAVTYPVLLAEILRAVGRDASALAESAREQPSREPVRSHGP